jgi:hypothetical protein
MTLIHVSRTVVPSSPWGGRSGFASLPAAHSPSRQSLRLHQSNSELNLITAKRRAGFGSCQSRARASRDYRSEAERKQ